MYVDREAVGDVAVTGVSPVRGGRVRLHLAGPLSADVPEGAELGRGLLSRRRLHDLRHSSASIQLAEGIDLALISKRLGHSTPTITGTLYAHLLRPAGQAAAEKVARAVPRRTQRLHPVCTGTDPASAGAPVAAPDGANMLVERRAWDSNPRRGSLPLAVFKSPPEAEADE